MASILSQTLSCPAEFTEADVPPAKHNRRQLAVRYCSVTSYGLKKSTGTSLEIRW
jgi:hypothetical protein